ncbi:MAG: hypothetical protein Sapg2KO_53560 [Saprospiraceae bacterium]
MKILSSTLVQGFNVNNNPLWYLVIGVATMTLTHMTFSIEVMAWVSSEVVTIKSDSLVILELQHFKLSNKNYHDYTRQVNQN